MDNVTLHNGDCLDVMAGMPDSSVDLILTDPPYFKVKNEPWDRQWDKPHQFLTWLDGVLAEFYRILKPNGSLYLFASPKMAARVECLIAERLNVLNQIRWDKTHLQGRHKGTHKEGLRSFFPAWEAIIFAEHYGADNIAKGEAGYAAKCDELRGFVFEPLRAYIVGEYERANVNPDDVAAYLNVTPTMVRQHYLSKSQWALPTRKSYEKQREALNALACGEYLQREYEDLRQEYEDLRRPFNVTADVPYTDTWTFDTVRQYPGKHPCEKPQAMLEHIITASSRPGAVVFDAFAGTGSTGIAAHRLGRDFIGCEKSEAHYGDAEKRMRNNIDLFTGDT